MGLKYIWTTIFSPVETFEKIRSEKPALIDSLLIFGFTYLLLLGTAFVVLSFTEPYYGIREFVSLFIGIPSMLFLRDPTFKNFLMSVGFALVDILLLTGIVHLITKKAGGKGSFSSLLMMFSLTEVVSVVSVLAFLPLQTVMRVGSPFFILPFFSIIVGVFVWRFALYFMGIRATYKSKVETTFLILIVSYIIFSIISVWLLSFVVKENVINVIHGMRTKTVAIPEVVD